MRAGIKMSRERVEQTRAGWVVGRRCGVGRESKKDVQKMEGGEEELMMKGRRERGGMKTRDGHKQPGGETKQ